MKVSYFFLTVGGLIALAWGSYLSFPLPEPVAQKQAYSTTLARTNNTHASPLLSSTALPTACGSGCTKPHRSVPEKNLPQEVTTLQQQVARLDRELTELRRQLDSGRTTTVAPDPEPDDVQTRERELREWQDKVAAIEHSFRQEPTDAAWAATTTEKIWEAFEAEGLAEFSVEAVQGLATRCRVEVALDSKTEELLPTFALHIADTLPKLTVKPVAEGDSRMVLFLTRADH